MMMVVVITITCNQGCQEPGRALGNFCFWAPHRQHHDSLGGAEAVQAQATDRKGRVCCRSQLPGLVHASLQPLLLLASEKHRVSEGAGRQATCSASGDQGWHKAGGLAHTPRSALPFPAPSSPNTKTSPAQQVSLQLLPQIALPIIVMIISSPLLV